MRRYKDAKTQREEKRDRFLRARERRMAKERKLQRDVEEAVRRSSSGDRPPRLHRSGGGSDGEGGGGSGGGGRSGGRGRGGRGEGGGGRGRGGCRGGGGRGDMSPGGGGLSPAVGGIGSARKRAPKPPARSSSAEESFDLAETESQLELVLCEGDRRAAAEPSATAAAAGGTGERFSTNRRMPRVATAAAGPGPGLRPPGSKASTPGKARPPQPAVLGMEMAAGSSLAPSSAGSSAASSATATPATTPSRSKAKARAAGGRGGRGGAAGERSGGVRGRGRGGPSGRTPPTTPPPPTEEEARCSDNGGLATGVFDGRGEPPRLTSLPSGESWEPLGNVITPRSAAPFFSGPPGSSPLAASSPSSAAASSSKPSSPAPRGNDRWDAAVDALAAEDPAADGEEDEYGIRSF